MRTFGFKKVFGLLMLLVACGSPESRRVEESLPGGHEGSIDAVCRELVEEASASLPEFLKKQPELALALRPINNLTRADIDANATEDWLREKLQDLKVALESKSNTVLSGELREIETARQERGPVDWLLSLSLRNNDQIFWTGSARRPRPANQVP